MKFGNDCGPDDRRDRVDLFITEYDAEADRAAYRRHFFDFEQELPNPADTRPVRRRKRRNNGCLELVLYTIRATLAWLVVFAAVSFGYEALCKNRVYEDLQTALRGDRMWSNVCVVRATITAEDETTRTIAYSYGAGGVVIAREGEICYVLTAAHVVGEEEGVKRFYFVVPCDEDQYREERSEAGETAHDYYKGFPQARVILSDREADLALLQMICHDPLNPVPLAGRAPRKGERIVAVGCPSGEMLAISYGKVTSRKVEEFDTGGGAPVNHVWHHSAYTAPGSSGGAVFNDKLELLGIHIGGGTDLFGNYRYGAMVSGDQLHDFLVACDERLALYGFSSGLIG